MASIRKRPTNPSPARHHVLEYKTPDIRDIVFYIHVDSRLAGYSAPAYGTAYESRDGEYPNHELVHVTTATSDGWVRWYYAAPREAQGEYNFDFKQPGASPGFSFYTRSYVIRRDDVHEYFGDHFDNLDGRWDDLDYWDDTAVWNDDTVDVIGPHTGAEYLRAGDPDPDFHYNPEFVDFEFTGLTVSRIGDKDLDSLFVVVTRKFERLCPQKKLYINPVTGGLEEIYTEIVPKGEGEEKPVDPVTGMATVRETLNCRWDKLVTKKDEKALGEGVDLGSMSYIPDLCSTITLLETIVPAGSAYPQPPNNDGVYTVITILSELWWKVTEKIDKDAAMIDKVLSGYDYDSSTCKYYKSTKVVKRSSELPDVLPKPTKDNPYTTAVKPISPCLSQVSTSVDGTWASLGVEKAYAKYFSKLCAYRDTWVKVLEKNDPAIETYKNTKPYYTAEDNAFVVPYYYEITDISSCLTKVEKKLDPEWALLFVTLKGYRYDERSGQSYSTEVTIVPSATIPLTPPAVFNDPETKMGFITTYEPLNSCLSRKVTKMVRSNLDRAYSTTVRYSLPAVLSHLETNNWRKRNGTEVSFFIPVYSREAETGVFLADVVEQWTPERPENLSTDTLHPTSISLSLPPWGTSVSVPKCLHGDINISATTGTTNPDYVLNYLNKTFPATTPAVLPDKLIISDVVTPIAGGYLRKTVTITIP